MTGKLRFGMRKQGSAGFTVIELMMATLVFSVVLLVVTTGIMQFSRVYYKGVTETNLQTTTRTITDTIAQSIQFNGGAVTSTTGTGAGTSYAFCIGDQQYSYILGTQLSDNGSLSANQSHHVLVVKDSAGCTTTAQDLKGASVTGRELMLPNARLVRLSISNVPTTNIYKISLRVVYGDDDLLCSPSVGGDCASSTVSTNLGNSDLRCKDATAGTQFCAVSDITTTVVKRVQ